jgi:hypothetical protein
MNSIAHDRVAVAKEAGAAAVHGNCGIHVSPVAERSPYVRVSGVTPYLGPDGGETHRPDPFVFGDAVPEQFRLWAIDENEFPESWVTSRW